MSGDSPLVQVPESAEAAGSVLWQRSGSAQSGAASAFTLRWQRVELRFDCAPASLLLGDTAEQVGLVGGGQARALPHHVGPQTTTDA